MFYGWVRTKLLWYHGGKCYFCEGSRQRRGFGWRFWRFKFQKRRGNGIGSWINCLFLRIPLQDKSDRFIKERPITWRCVGGWGCSGCWLTFPIGWVNFIWNHYRHRSALEENYDFNGISFICVLVGSQADSAKRADSQGLGVLLNGELLNWSENTVC